MTVFQSRPLLMTSLALIAILALIAGVRSHLNSTDTISAAARQQPESQPILAANAAAASHSAKVDIASTEARVATLKAELEKITGQMSKASIQSAKVENAPVELAAAIAAAELKNEQYVDLLAGTIERESVDSSWSAAANADISRSLFDPALAESRLDDVRCYQSLCRIDITHDSPTSDDAFTTQLLRLDTFRDVEGFIERQQRPDGSLTTTMYMSRSGQKLPARDQAP